MPRGARRVAHMAIPSMILFNPDFPDPDAPETTRTPRPQMDKRRSSRLQLLQSPKAKPRPQMEKRRSSRLQLRDGSSSKSKSERSLVRRRTSRMESFKGLRQNSLIHKSLDKIVVDTIDGIIEEKSEKPSERPPRSRRADFARRGSRRITTTASSSSQRMLPRGTSYSRRPPVAVIREGSIESRTSSGSVVDSLLQSKFKNLEIVF